MKRVIPYLLFVPAVFCRAQQAPVYSQYTFNRAGVNPAASGTDMTQKLNFAFGIDRQWVGFDHAPKTNFANFSFTKRPPRSYHYWQNIGGYVDNQENGISNNSGVYFTYAFHLLLKKNTVMSYGFNAGVRTYFIDASLLDKSDPVLQKTSFRTLVYPDIIPGFRLSTKTFFIDLSARQLTIPALQDYRGHTIGSPSRLNPTLFFSYGRLIHLSDYFLLLPSVAVTMPFISVPNIDVNAMLYYNNRMGFGVALRNTNFFTGIYQIRMAQNITVGLAYSVSINSMFYGSPHSFEVMVGLPPFGMMTKPFGKFNIARCPRLDY